MVKTRLLRTGRLLLVFLAVFWLALQSGAYFLLRRPWVLSHLRDALRGGLRAYDLAVSFRSLDPGPGLGFEIDGLTLRDLKLPDHPAVLRVTHLYVRLDLLRLLLNVRHPEAAVAEILLDRPQLTIARQEEGGWLWERFRAAEPTRNRFRAVLRLHQGRVRFITTPFPHDLGREMILTDARLDLGDYPRLGGWAEIRTDFDARLRLDVNGSYDLERGRGQADLQWENAAAARWQAAGWFPARPVQVADGLLSGRARLWFDGQVHLDEATLRLSGGRLRYNAPGWPWMGASGEAHLRGQLIELGEVRISTRRSTLRVDGRLSLGKPAPRVEGVVRLSALDLGEAASLLPLPDGVAAGGMVSGRITVAGPLPTPRLGGEITLAGGTIALPSLPQAKLIRARGRFAGDTLLLETLGGEMGGARLTGSGKVRLFPAPSLDLGLAASEISLARTMTALGQPGWRGQTGLDVRLQYAPGHLEAAADLTWRETSWREAPLPPGTGRISLRGTGGTDLALEGGARLGDGLVSFAGYRKGPAWQGTGRVERLDLAPFGVFLGLAPEDLDGVAAGEIGWRIDREGPAVTAAVQVDRPTLAGRKLDALKASLVWQDGIVKVEGGHLRQGDAEALVRGRYLLGRGEMALDLSLHRFPLDTLMPGAGGWADGRLNLSGRWPVRFDGRGWARLYDLAWRGISLGAAEFELELAENRLLLERGRLTADDGQAEFSGTVGLTAERALALVVTGVDWNAGSLAVLLPGQAGLRGRLRGEGRIGGTLAAPIIDARLTAGPGEIYDTAWDSASAVLHWEDRLLVEEGRIKALGTEIEFGGSVGREGWDLAVRAREAQFAAVAGALPAGVPLPVGRFGGRVAFSGRIFGPLAAPVLEGEVAGTDLGIGGFTCASLSGRFALRDGVLSLMALARDENRSYEAEGRLDLARRMAALDLRLQRGDLSGLLSLAGIRPPWPIKGAVTGQANLAGMLDRPHLQGTLRLEEGAVGPVDLGGWAVFAYDGRTLRLDRCVLTHGDGSLTASGQASPDGLMLEIDGKALPLAKLAELAGYKDILAGRADLRMSLTKSGTTLRGTYRATMGAGAAWASIPLDRVVAEGTIEDRWIRLSRAEVVSGGHTLQAAGRLPFPDDLGPGEALLRGIPPARGGLDLTVEASRLALPLLNPAIGKLLAFDDGELDLTARVTGSWSAPAIAGRLAVAGGRGRTGLLPKPFTDLTAQAELAAGDVIIRSAKARIGGGAVELGGTIALSPAGWRYDLRLRGQRVPYQNPFFFDGQAARLDLAVTGGPLPRVTGEIEIAESTITVGSGVITGPPPPPLPLDIRITAGRDVRFFLPGVADIPFDGRLRLQGTLVAPTLAGTIEVTRGAVYVYGERFTLTEGTAAFLPDRGYLPYVELRAQKTVRGTLLLAVARGEITENGLTILLRSEPPLGQQEILSLLRWSGEPGGAVPGPTPGSMALGGLELVVDTVFGQLSEDFRRLIDADQFQLGMDEQSGGLSLQLGKFFSDDLYVSYKIQLNETEDRAWSFDYRLSPFLVLSGVFSTTEDPTWSLAYQIRF